MKSRQERPLEADVHLDVRLDSGHTHVHLYPLSIPDGRVN